MYALGETVIQYGLMYSKKLMEMEGVQTNGTH